MARPPGGEDDQPVTVIGGSLEVFPALDQYWTILDDTHAVYSYSKTGTPADPGARTRKVWLTLGDDDPITVVNAAGRLEVVLQMDHGAGQAVEVRFFTDANGQNLTMETRIPIRAWLRHQGSSYRHPHKGRKVRTVVVIPPAPAIPTTKAVSGGNFSLVIQSDKTMP